MIDYTQSQISNGGVLSYPIAPASAGLIVDGAPVIGSLINGVMHAAVSTNGTSDVFLGVAFGPRRELSAVKVAVDKFTIANGSLTFTSPRTTVVVGADANPKIYKRDAVTGAITFLAPDVSAAAGKYVINSTAPLSVTFAIADAGDVYIEYNYNPTLQDVMYQTGLRPGAYSLPTEDFLGRVAVINTGVIATDQIDNAALWNGAGTVRSIAGGKFTWGGASGTDLSGAGVKLLSAPSYGNPFVTISLNS